MNTAHQRAAVPVVVIPPTGGERTLAPGEDLVFGREWTVDLPLDGDPSLSRTAGRITATAGGVFIANLSTKRALYVQVGADRMRLPPAPEDGVGVMITGGEVGVGTSTMLRRGLAITVRLGDPASRPAAHRRDQGLPTTGTAITLDVMTKEFMVAFLLCRPWLLDPTRTTPLPDTPELGRLALELTGAHHLLRGYRTSPARDVISSRVNDHLRELRQKLHRASLTATDRLPLPALAGALLHFDVITRRHLALPDDPRWLTAQENKWWN
ncbi:hypothetical protein EDD29_8542 [Actinocorallia herbida]|uniref:FHA domain-containing protein n=1 Tax=Actinocorallia herbida TaxID=58109 RepID=A0A3N1DBA3_9ACTN|nr:hypothetical protein [Actinocorallia herbida]ROO90803.1 hypothetical protein EDD29_8542 [Actinocorallia herbida]